MINGRNLPRRRTPPPAPQPHTRPTEEATEKETGPFLPLPLMGQCSRSKNLTPPGAAKRGRFFLLPPVLKTWSSEQEKAVLDLGLPPFQ